MNIMLRAFRKKPCFYRFLKKQRNRPFQIPSPIRTVPSALDLHQVSRYQLLTIASRGLRRAFVITAGRELHPTLKAGIQLGKV